MNTLKNIDIAVKESTKDGVMDVQKFADIMVGFEQEHAKQAYAAMLRAEFDATLANLGNVSMGTAPSIPANIKSVEDIRAEADAYSKSVLAQEKQQYMDALSTAFLAVTAASAGGPLSAASLIPIGARLASSAGFVVG